MKRFFFLALLFVSLATRSQQVFTVGSGVGNGGGTIDTSGISNRLTAAVNAINNLQASKAPAFSPGFALWWQSTVLNVDSTRAVTFYRLYKVLDSLKALGWGTGGGGSPQQLSPPALSALASGSTAINATVGTVSGASSYELDWSANGSNGWTQLSTGAGTFNHTGLAPSTTYYYRARAIGDGTSYLTSGYAAANATTSAAGNTFTGTYYVSATGSDANDGYTAATPFQTIAKVNTLDLNPGEKVLFKGGDTFSGTINLTSEDAGTSGSPVEIGKYGTGTPVISSGTARGLYAVNLGGFEIRDLKFVGTGGGIANDGIKVHADGASTDYDYVKINNCEVTGYGGRGIYFVADNTQNGFNNVTVQGCVSHANYDGITVRGYWNPSIGGVGGMELNHTNVIIRSCLTYNNAGSTQVTNNHSGSGIFMAAVDGGLVEYCVAYGNGASNACNGCGPIGIWTAESNNVTIQFNESYANKRGTGLDGGGFDIDGGATNAVIQYNYSHDNDGAGYLVAEWGSGNPFTGNVIRYNLSVNDAQQSPGYGSLHFHNVNAGAAFRVYNNTFYNSGKPGLGFSSTNSWTSAEVRNNIFYITGSTNMKAGTMGTGYTFSNNLYYATGGATLDFSTGGTVADPLLTNPGASPTVGLGGNLAAALTAYTIGSGSPAIGTGTAIASPGSRDFFGNPIPNGTIDIGAHEGGGNAVSGPLTYAIAQTDVWDNVRNIVSQPMTDAHAFVQFETNAASIGLILRTYEAEGVRNVGVWVNGTFLTLVSPDWPGTTGNNPWTTPLTINIGASGVNKTVMLVNGPQGSGYTAQRDVPDGAFVTSILYPAGSTLTMLPPSATTERLVLIGDSQAGGNPDASVVAKVRNVYNRRVLNSSWGWNALVDLIGNGPGNHTINSAKLSAVAARIAAASPKYIWVEAGVNDLWMYNTSALTTAEFSTLYAAFVDALNAAAPSAKIICQTLFPMFGSTADWDNGVGGTLYGFRQAVRDVAAARSSYCIVVEGTDLVTPGQIGGDGIHLTQAGRDSWAQGIDATLDALDGYGNGSQYLTVGAMDAGITESPAYTFTADGTSGRFITFSDAVPANAPGVYFAESAPGTSNNNADLRMFVNGSLWLSIIPFNNAGSIYWYENVGFADGLVNTGMTGGHLFGFEIFNNGGTWSARFVVSTNGGSSWAQVPGSPVTALPAGTLSLKAKFPGDGFTRLLVNPQKMN